MSTALRKVRSSGAKGGETPERKYTSETCQMMFVFGEVLNPISETLNIVEDIVRSQVIELIFQARALATKRGARYISTEDLMFLIRHDRSKVNRLRTYLSWKDVGKHAKGSGGDGGGGMEAALDEADEKLTGKAQKITIKLPWEIPSVYSEVLRQIGRQSDDEEDEEELGAQEISLQRLKEADDATRQMTGHNTSITPGVVKPLSPTAKLNAFASFLIFHPSSISNQATQSISLAFWHSKCNDYASARLGKRKSNTRGSSAEKRRRESSTYGDQEYALPVNSLFIPPLETKTPLRPEHIQNAFDRMQSEWSHSRSSGMRNWRGGLIKASVSLI